MIDLTMPPVAPVAFNGVVAFAWIGVFLIVGMFLRAVFPLFKKYLIPACIIGGTVGLLFQSSGLLNITGYGYSNAIMQNITYHLFNLTFITIGLRVPVKKEGYNPFGSRIMLWSIGIFLAIPTFTYGTAMLSTVVTGMFGLNNGGPATMGILVGQGFVTGPGQALTVANVWTATKGYIAMADFALAGAAMGFAVAILLGIFLMNIIARKKKLDNIACPTEDEECGFYGECVPTEDAGQQTTSATSIDVLAWHLGLILATYFLTFIIGVSLTMIVPQSIAVIIWTLFFLLCTMVSMSVRTIIVKIGKSHLLCSGINNRISNTLIDFMVCATFMSINIGNVGQYIWPYLASVTVSVVTIGVCSWLYCRKLKEEGPETFAYVFGSLTGTVSTALILLRLVDPSSKSAIPVRAALANALCLPNIFITPVLVHFEALYGYSAWAAIGGLYGLAIAGFILAWVFKQPQTEYAWQPEE